MRWLSLETTDRLADALAAAIVESTDDVNPQVAKLQVIALARVIQTITDESGRRKLARQSPTEIVDDLRPIVAAIIDSLDRWLVPARTKPGTARRVSDRMPTRALPRRITPTATPDSEVRASPRTTSAPGMIPT